MIILCSDILSHSHWFSIINIILMSIPGNIFIYVIFLELGLVGQVTLILPDFLAYVKIFPLDFLCIYLCS